MENIDGLSPMQALLVSAAYVVMADKKALPEERAALVSLLGKHVSKKELSQTQMQRMTANAFAYVAQNDFTHFLVAIEGTLTPSQMLAILSNMYEIMIVDGNVVSGEKVLIDEFVKFFDIDRRVVNTIREILMVKNDTSLFFRKDHPNNGSDFRFKFLDKMDLEQ